MTTAAAATVDEGAMLALATELIRARGENPGGTEAATVEVLAEACTAAGMTVTTTEVEPGRPNLLATYDPGGDKGVLFLGHSDVVPAVGEWSHPPFEGVVEGDRLLGRGSADMKGGLAAVVSAVDAVRRSGADLEGPVVLACTVDEEDLDIGIRAFVEVGLPDQLAGRLAGCVVAEPTDLDVVVACRGDAYLELEITGVPAHSGRPGDGRNAIAAAARVIDLIGQMHETLADQVDPLLGSATFSVGRIEGGTLTSIVAERAHLWVDRRLLPGEDPDTLLADLLRAARDVVGDGIGIEGEVTMRMPGFRTDPDSPFGTAVQRAGRAIGHRTQLGTWTAACDGGYVVTELGLPTVILGPGDLNEQAHQVDESVAVADLVTAARWYATLIASHADL